MNKDKIIYSLCVEDVLDVIKENKMKIKLDDKAVNFIEEKIGDIIDWRGAIESALYEYEYKDKRENING